MKKQSEDYTLLFEEIKKSTTSGWVLLTDEDLALYDQIREIREIVMDTEMPDFQLSSRT